MGGDCLFCKIVSGELPSQKVYEDADTAVIKDINPQAPTHLLILPKKHIRGLSDVSEADTALLGHLLQVARDLAKRGGLDSGFRVVINNGRGGGQTVDHLHCHLLGGRRLIWPPG